MTTLSRRDFLALSAVTGAGALLAACGSSVPLAATGPPVEGDYDGPPVTLEYWNGFTGGDGPAMRQLVTDFNNSQDRITVRMNVVQWAQYYQRVVAAVHAGQGPDVGAMHVEQLATQAVRRSITPIDEVITELGLSAEEYPADVWEAGVYDGKRYGIPLDVHSLGSYANTALLKQAGLSGEPGAGADLERALTTLVGAGVETPFWMPNRWPAHLIFLSLLWQFGGEPYAEDGSAATFDSDAGVQALTWMRSQIDNKFSPPNVAQDSQYTAFKNGEGAFTWDGIWQINDLGSTAPDLAWSLAPVPTIGTEPAVWANSHQLVMFRSRQPDDDRLVASKTFIRFLIENSASWAAAGMIPARSQARESKDFLASPQAAVAEAIPSMRFLPPIPALGEVQAQTLETAVSNAILGVNEPQAALAAAAEQASALMQGNLRKFARGEAL
ncbi:ABC transporter substrate-binding protein [Georgenia yuyongxinii]|uniref:ABC transporter substrate-binding protein n=1 Tax=Georgenia yuyongxinii TaxID=2589797 RepID=A0A5B8C7Z6_9MICO|nr:ABC transporter substrate-binding protein [Georgenia yuyongxinii]QDC26733.1 ABC transporter substrate-binding protein [Georgenia yuyongxinii]